MNGGQSRCAAGRHGSRLAGATREARSREMRDVLAQDTDYYWGWQNLADWTCDAGETALYLEAAEAMVRLAPDNVGAAQYRGDARLKTGDRDGAKDEFRRAIEKSPLGCWAAFQLFDVELEDRNFETAGQVLKALKSHDGGRFVVAREVQLAAAPMIDQPHPRLSSDFAQ